MARGLNKVFLLGNLGDDPVMRETNSGLPVCNFSLATNERGQKNGEEWTDHTEWHRIVCFGRLAETVSEFASRGRSVHVEGSIRTRKYEDREGVSRSSTEILAREVTFLDNKSNGETRSDNNQQEYNQQF